MSQNSSSPLKHHEHSTQSSACLLAHLQWYAKHLVEHSESSLTTDPHLLHYFHHLQRPTDHMVCLIKPFSVPLTSQCCYSYVTGVEYLTGGEGYFGLQFGGCSPDTVHTCGLAYSPLGSSGSKGSWSVVRLDLNTEGPPLMSNISSKDVYILVVPHPVKTALLVENQVLKPDPCGAL